MSPRGRIAYVSHVSILGGAERSLLDLLASLDRARFEPIVVAPEAGELTCAAEALGARVRIAAGLRRLQRARHPGTIAAQIASVVRGARALRAIVAGERPQLVHANSTTALLYAAAGVRAATPIVWHVRDMRPLGPLLSMLRWRCAAIVAPSHAAARTVGAGHASSRLHVIPNGIDLADPPEAELELPPGPRVCVIGELVAWKRHQVAIDVARRVLDRRADVQFLLVGGTRFHPGSDLPRALRERIRAAGLEGSVHLLGHRDDARAVLAASTLLLHPAHPEPFGRVVVEALAAGRPVVAVGGDHGPTEILAGGAGGVLVARDDVEAMADAVLRLIADPAELGARGRRHALARYDRRQMAHRIESVYDDVIARAARNAATAGYRKESNLAS